MKKEELARLVDEYGDAVITFRSENSNKLKYNVCTLDFSTPYIQQKKNRAKRNLARRIMKRKLGNSINGMDIHHVDGNPNNNSSSNLKVVSKRFNRSRNA